MSSQAEAQPAGAVCDRCGAPDTAAEPLVEVVLRVEGWPAHVWYCPRCLKGLAASVVEVEQEGCSVEVQP